MNVSAIILAAGLGERMGSEHNKILLDICGRPLLLYSVRAFGQVSAIGEIVIVVRAGEEAAVQAALEGFDRPIRFVQGGEVRRDSSLSGVRAARGEHVLIHDGARPFATSALIERVIEAAARHSAAIPVLPAADTLHVRRSDAATLVRTLDRTSIVQAQTPQGFARSLVLDALERAPESVTDDAAAVLALGHAVHCVDGDPRNLKVTRPEDVVMAESIARVLAAEGSSDIRTPVV
ncbi:2-C-methyl-D-erythritol 4-phosphate cytidylyltransferase [Candidatus Bipolaricaulota bacterium]